MREMSNLVPAGVLLDEMLLVREMSESGEVDVWRLSGAGAVIEPDLPPTEDPLTEREMEVLKLIAQGHSNRQIGERIHLSERTVAKYTSNILDKLHLANRTQAALYAFRKGIANLEPEDPE